MLCKYKKNETFFTATGRINEKKTTRDQIIRNNLE